MPLSRLIFLRLVSTPIQMKAGTGLSDILYRENVLLNAMSHLTGNTHYTVSHTASGRPKQDRSGTKTKKTQYYCSINYGASNYIMYRADMYSNLMPLLPNSNVFSSYLDLNRYPKLQNLWKSKNL